MKGFIFFLLVLVGCGGHKQPDNPIDNSAVKAKYFREVFLKKFKPCDLPCSIEHKPDVIKSNFNIPDPNSLDTLFFDQRMPVYFGSIVSDTSDFIIVNIYLPALTVIPNMVVFDSNGSIIDIESFDFGCWDGGHMIIRAMVQ